MRWSRPRKYAGEEKLTPDELERRGTIVRLAQDAFGSTKEAIAFLNAENSELGGRPLDLATASAAGLQAVEEMLRKVLSV